MRHYLKRDISMFAKVFRPLIGVFVGLNFVYLINSALFFSDVEIQTESSDYVLLMVMTCFLPMILSILLVEVDMTMNRNLLGYLAFFMLGLSIGQLLFTIFNDKFIERHTKTAYIETQRLLNISDDVTYSKRQLEFMNDKKANNFEALNKYVIDRDSLAVAGVRATANLLLSMNGNKDPVLQEAFDIIIKDKVVTVQEIDEFNKLVINQKMK